MRSEIMIDVALRKRFEALIRARGGLNMREQEAPALQKVLRARTAALRLPSPASYLDWLEKDSPASASEWKQLWVLLTNQESYFFRDAEQLGVLSNHILPALMRRNRDHRTLRIWSAGCSTGEEPYSLAMMLEEMPALAGWRVTLVGTDISEAALARARRGVYGEWSFRALSAARRARFFTPCGKEWEIAPPLRDKVLWAPNNLLADPFPTPASATPEGELHDLDLIVCRNVFIYFDRPAVARVLKKFAATLRPGGFLVCGHAELHDVPPGDFEARAYPQSVIYQRAGALRADALPGEARKPLTSHFSASRPDLRPPTQTPPPQRAIISTRIPPAIADSTQLPSLVASRVANPTRSSSATAPNLAPVAALPNAANSADNLLTAGVSPGARASAMEMLERAQAQIRGGRAALGLEMVGSLLESEPGFLAGWCVLAQAQADAGRLDEAQQSCTRALEISPLATLPYLLQARIAEERGEAEAAKVLLKKVIYLNPRSVWAPLELSAIYRREGDFQRAAQMQRAALELLDSLADEAEVPAEEHSLELPLRAGELKRQLRTQLDDRSVNPSVAGAR